MHIKINGSKFPSFSYCQQRNIVTWFCDRTPFLLSHKEYDFIAKEFQPET